MEHHISFLKYFSSAYYYYYYIATVDSTCPNGKICINALTGINYHVKYSNNSISEIYADITTGTLKSCNQKSAVQSFNVDFSSKVAPSSPSYNKISRIKSGNPGYLNGRSLLVGLIQTNGIYLYLYTHIYIYIYIYKVLLKM